MTETIRQERPSGLLAVGAFASPRTYFEEIVSPNVDLLLRDNGSKQFAFNAAVGIYHMADYVCEFALEHELNWFPDGGVAGIKRYREKLLARCPEFGIAEAVALVYKHYRIGNVRAKQIAPTILSVLREVEILQSNVDLTAFPEEMRPSFAMDFTKPYRARERIIVRDGGGKTYVLHEVFSIVRDMWRKELGQLGMEAATPSELKR